MTIMMYRPEISPYRLYALYLENNDYRTDHISSRLDVKGIGIDYSECIDLLDGYYLERFLVLAERPPGTEMIIRGISFKIVTQISLLLPGSIR